MLTSQEILRLNSLFVSYKNTLHTIWQPFAELFMLPVEAALKNVSPSPDLTRALTICSQKALISLLKELGFNDDFIGQLVSAGVARAAG